MKRLVLLLTVILFGGTACSGEFDARREIIKLMENSRMEKYLQAPVTVTETPTGILSIADTGIFAIQHELLSPEASADPNIVMDKNITIAPSADKLVVVTHGWLDKGQKDWPTKMAEAIRERTDPNEWVCAAYDWKGGSVVITSVQAAEYAREIAGPRLASAVLKLDRPFRHIHLIGHSAGSWTIHAAARRIAEVRPETTFHLTFLDAYVPDKWDPDELGRIFDDNLKQNIQVWADQYYTKDITYKVTQYDLKNAHNVDLTAIDPFIAEHEFPYRWYMATITGRYDRWDEKKEPVYTQANSIDYGFARCLESGRANWALTQTLRPNNPAVKIEKSEEVND
jgi:hypothetical protein